MSNNYTGIRRLPQAARTSERLLAMRQGSLRTLRAERDDSSLLLATWNVRDFDNNKFGFGPRLDESFYYLAEIMSCFDLIAIQEVNENLRPFERVLSILGSREWDYLVTDVTEGTSGNGERMAFLFRRDKVWFRHIAGEVVLPEGQLIVAPEAVSSDDAAPAAVTATAVRHQFARSPYMVAFQSGWFRFSICTVHIYYGKESGPALERRINEIQALVDFFAARQDAEAQRLEERAGTSPGNGHRPAELSLENYILLGDFNVVSPEHRTMQALQSNGFSVPEQIGAEAIATRDHFYDQIAVRVKDPRFKVTTGGIVPVFSDVFRDEDEPGYREHVAVPADEDDDAETSAARYRKWRTWQMSDHSPLWIKIETDFTDSYLQGLLDQG